MNRANGYVTLILCLLAATQTALAQQAVDDIPFEIGGHLTSIKLGPLETIFTTPERVFRSNVFNTDYLYERHTKIWMKRYGTGSGSDRVVLWDARSNGARSLPLPVPYRRALPSTPHLGVPLI